MPSRLPGFITSVRKTVTTGRGMRPVPPQLPGITGSEAKSGYKRGGLLLLSESVGLGGENLADDVINIHAMLMNIGKIPCYVTDGSLDEMIIKGIMEAQAHFMRQPDGLIRPNGLTHRYLMNWSDKPIAKGVVFNTQELKRAWDLVSPLLPPGSYCASAYRSADDQRRILHQFFTKDYRAQIIKKYGQNEYDRVSLDPIKNESEVLKMVRGVGQAIASPGKSKHQQGKAIDIGGPDAIDAEQVRVVKQVAKAHPLLFSGVVLKERNGCVHFEID